MARQVSEVVQTRREMAKLKKENRRQIAELKRQHAVKATELKKKATELEKTVRRQNSVIAAHEEEKRTMREEIHRRDHDLKNQVLVNIARFHTNRSLKREITRLENVIGGLRKAKKVPVCKQCKKCFLSSGARRPRQLACGHNFCDRCLEAMYQSRGTKRSITCPTCNKPTSCRYGLNADDDIGLARTLKELGI